MALFMELMNVAAEVTCLVFFGAEFDARPTVMANPTPVAASATAMTMAKARILRFIEIRLRPRLANCGSPVPSGLMRRPPADGGVCHVGSPKATIRMYDDCLIDLGKVVAL